MQLPNFLIVGAAKCGTTAVASYLTQHPQVYFSPLKEPKFISSHFVRYPLRGPGDDFIETFTVKDLNEYSKLFRRAGPRTAIGEGSVENFYYFRQSIPLIKKYFGDPRIIIILRDPVARAFSAFKQLLRDRREDRTFEEGLFLESERKTANWEYLWFYRECGFYSEATRAFLENFSRVQIMLFDDLRKDAAAFMKQIYAFLEVNDTFSPKLNGNLNASGVVKDGLLTRLFEMRKLTGAAYKFLALRGISDSHILYMIEKVRHRKMRQVHMNPATEQFLRGIYRQDIMETQDILRTDLSEWIRN